MNKKILYGWAAGLIAATAVATTVQGQGSERLVHRYLHVEIAPDGKTVAAVEGDSPPSGYSPPLRELGNDPASGKQMVIKDGRFGPYVTDGETNASLRKGDDVLSITDERAAELLADRRARGPVKRTAKKTARKSPAKKAAKRT